MKIECPFCKKIIEIDDSEVKTYTARLSGKGCTDAKRAALTANAKKPRPGAQGKPKPRKPKPVE